VILAFANSNSDGSLSIDTANWPTSLIKNWQASGKKVIISVGGQNGNWPVIFANPQNFINSVQSILTTYNLDGVDLDIENYNTNPQTVALTINSLRAAIGKSKQIIVSPENVAINEATYWIVPTPLNNVTSWSSNWNYFVPIINQAIDSIDYVQPQYYNNGYSGLTAGSASFMVNGVLEWMNKQGIATGDEPITGYNGVPANKLVIGVLASTSAGNSSYYAGSTNIATAISTLHSTYGIDVAGVMMWDSHWDTLNGNVVSNEAAAALGL
jgi:chitinase